MEASAILFWVSVTKHPPSLLEICPRYRAKDDATLQLNPASMCMHHDVTRRRPSSLESHQLYMINPSTT